MQSEVRELSSGKIYINTGSVPIHLPIEGLEVCARYSEDMMELDELPERLIIIGGGYIGLEFASMYANFGSHVTVLQDRAEFLPQEDPDIAEKIRGLLEAQGIVFRLGVRITHVSEGREVFFTAENGEKSVTGDAILAATGRKPNTEGLSLEKAGVEINARGAVVTDNHLRTTQEGVFAMGDVTGRQQFTYLSLDDYRILSRDGYSQENRKNVPYSVFMDTPYARVGINEKEAKLAGLSYRVLTLPVAAIPKAQVLKKTGGLMKALVESESGKILGAMLLCEEAYEVINIVKLAMDLGASGKVLRDQIFTHPTMSEALGDLFLKA